MNSSSVIPNWSSPLDRDDFNKTKKMAVTLTNAIINETFESFLCGQLNIDLYLNTAKGYARVHDFVEERWNELSQIAPNKQQAIQIMIRSVERELHSAIPKTLQTRLRSLREQYDILLHEHKELGDQLNQKQIDLALLHCINTKQNEMVRAAETIARIQVYLNARNIECETIEEFPANEYQNTQLESEMEPETEGEWTQQLHVFHRKLDGGYVETVDGLGYISEKWVRTLGLEDGDKVRAVKRYRLREGTGFRYEFEIAEKVGRQQTDRIVLERCIIGQDYRIEYYANGKPIEIDGQHRVFPISRDDVTKKCLKIGDEIDLAYPAGKPGKAKVIWKYT